MNNKQIKISKINFSSDLSIKKSNITINVPFTKYNKHSKTNNIYKQFKKELDLLNKYINNDIIYNVIYKWGTKYKNKFYNLDSQISIYEGLFISEIIKAYIKSSMKNINVLEIGCAYGTSAMFIINMLNNYNKKINYKIIDPNQDTQWNNVGLYNISRIKNDNINVEWLKGYSDITMEYLTKQRLKYDIIFIDGGHGFEIVMSDSMYADKLLKKNGIVIHDDVLHSGVKEAINKFYKNNKHYIKISLKYDSKKPNIITDTKLYNYSRNKTNFHNPKTMFAFRKII